MRIDPHQMLRLRDMLDREGIAYARDDGMWGEDSWRTYSQNFEIMNGMCVEGWSCVLHGFSYGHEVGLLEFWGKGDEDVSGFLSADNVIERVRRTM